MTKPKLSVVPAAEKTLGDAADEQTKKKKTFEELQVANIARISALQQEGFGGLVGGPLLQLRLEILIEATVGSVGENRNNFETVFENRLPIMLDQVENLAKMIKAQRLAGPGAAVTDGGLIVPS